MTSREQLLALFESSDSEIDFTGLILTKPVGIVRNERNHNTVVSLKAPMDSTGYTGGKLYTYTRIDFKELFKGIKPSLNCTIITTHELAIEQINKQYNLDLLADEFVENTPSVEEGYTLLAKDDNYKYVNGIHFEHRINLADTADIQLNGFDTPSEFIRGEIYGLSLGEIESVYLTTIEEGPANTEILYRLLKLNSDDDWRNSYTTENFNVYNATVESVTKSNDDGVYKSFVKIRLDTGLSTATTSEIHLRGVYNRTMPESTKVNFSEISGMFSRLQKGSTLTVEEAAQISDEMGLKGIPSQRISASDEVVYNGPVSNVPDDYIHLLPGHATTNVTIFDADSGYVVFAH